MPLAQSTTGFGRLHLAVIAGRTRLRRCPELRAPYDGIMGDTVWQAAVRQSEGPENADSNQSRSSLNGRDDRRSSGTAQVDWPGFGAPVRARRRQSGVLSKRHSVRGIVSRLPSRADIGRTTLIDASQLYRVPGVACGCSLMSARVDRLTCSAVYDVRVRQDNGSKFSCKRPPRAKRGRAIVSCNF